MNKVTSVNPATEKNIKDYKRLSDSTVKLLLQKSHKAFEAWKQTSFKKRAAILRKAATLLIKNKETYALLITNEMGKLFTASVKEVEKCALTLQYYANNAETFLTPETVKTEALKSYVTFNPLGVLLAVMPWNFPFFQVIRFAAPALMAGNTVILKHASNVQGCAKALENLFTEAGLPAYCFTNINISGEQVKAVIEDKNIAAVTLTGSEGAGRKVAAAAGAALKKCVMELGGSDAFIILKDADVKKAVDMAVSARLQNNGQTCIAAKRFIVEEKIYDFFLEEFTIAMAAKKMGSPTDALSFYGPLSRKDLRDELHTQVLKSIKQGAKLKTGGYIPNMSGAYYPATVLANVKPGMTAFEEELFGPVAAVIKAKDATHAIELANQSVYGLGGVIVSGNVKKAETLAAQHLQCGSAFINKMVASDPRLPFGGVKHSGFGRELSAYGIKEFVNIKTVWVDEMK